MATALDPSPLFPLELFHKIIDASPEDLELQKTLSLVSREFFLRSRPHFFHSIEFKKVGDNADARTRLLHARFHAILLNNPSIASYVQSLLLYDASEEFDPPDDERRSWIRDEPSLLETLETLSRGGLTRFTLWTDLHWSSFRADLRQAFLFVFLAPNLVELRLIGLEGISRASCPVFRYAREVFLSSVELDDWSDDEDDEYLVPAPDVRPATTSYLELENMQAKSLGILRTVLLEKNPFQLLHQLQVLKVHSPDHNSGPVISELVRAARGSLTEFYWTHYNHDVPIGPLPIDLSTAMHLRKISIDLPLLAQRRPGPDPFETIFQLLWTVRADNQIIFAKFEVHFPDYLTAWDSVQHYDGWIRLAGILDHWEALELMSIWLRVMILPSTIETDLEELEEELTRRIFNRLQREVIIEVVAEWFYF